MKISAKNLLTFLRNNDDSIKKYIGVDFSTMHFEEDEDLLSFIMKNVFFYNDNKFSYKELNERKNKDDLIQILLKETYISCEKEKDDINLYKFFNKLFSQFIYPITIKYGKFLDSIASIKEKYPYDLFACLIAFLSFLNGNKNYINIFQDVCDNILLINLKMKYDIYRNKMLWKIITNYCNLHNIAVINKLNEDININELKNQLIEINCFVDICQVNPLYKKLGKTIFQCLSSCDFKDLRQNRLIPVKAFIESVFLLLNLYMANDKYSQEYYLSFMFSKIFSKAYEYISKYQNENYVDFVVQYVVKYELPSEDFFDLFMTGLDKENFKVKFKNIKLPEDNINIDDKDTIKNMVTQMLSRKKKKKKSKKAKSSNKNDEIQKKSESKDIKVPESLFKNDEIKNNQEESKKSLNQKENKETQKRNNLTEDNEKEDSKVNNETQNSISKNDSNNNCELLKLKNDSNIQIENPISSIEFLQKEISDLKNKYSELEKKMTYKISNLEKDKGNINSRITNLEKENDNMNSKITNLENDIANINSKITNLENGKIIIENKIMNLEEDIKDLKIENGEMKNQISSLNIKVRKANEDAGNLNKLIEIINFRDLTKRMLDNMVGYVEEKDKNIFNGISKRKEKLKVIIEKFNFKDIQYMKRAIEELKEKYYNSNIFSHEPDYIRLIQEQPYDLIADLEGYIANKYYKLMIDSKDKRIYDFMINHLYIKKEIKSIYFDKIKK